MYVKSSESFQFMKYNNYVLLQETFLEYLNIAFEVKLL